MGLATFLKKYRSMILCSIFFFYFGCGVTLSLLKMDCAEVTRNSFLNSKFNLHSKIEYAVLILSGPSNQAKRDAIRNSWMRLASNIAVENGKRIYKWNSSPSHSFTIPEYIKFYFVIGTKLLSHNALIKINNEAKMYNDLLLLDDFSDGYNQLSEKMLNSLKWFSENLRNLKYLIKCDDDSFVRIDVIIRDLEAFAPSMNDPEIAEYVSYKHGMPSAKGLYWGYFHGKARVYLTGKWKEEDWFLCDRYLPYALGGGYVISRHIVDYLGMNNELLSPYNSEDVSMGVWTAALRNINRVHDIRFDTEWTSRGCSNDMIVRHKQNTTDMIQMYKNLVDSIGYKLCSNVSVIRKDYRYKWDRLPSQCCK